MQPEKTGKWLGKTEASGSLSITVPAISMIFFSTHRPLGTKRQKWASSALTRKTPVEDSTWPGQVVHSVMSRSMVLAKGGLVLGKSITTATELPMVDQLLDCGMSDSRDQYTISNVRRSKNSFPLYQRFLWLWPCKLDWQKTNQTRGF